LSRFSAGCRRPLTLAVVVCAGALTLPATAGAAATCSFAAGTATVNVPSNDDATVGRNVAGNIQLNGANCSTATVANTDTIRIDGPGTTALPGHQDVILSLANGPLAPGLTAEVGSTPEIEIVVQLGNGFDSLALVGSAAADNYRLGTTGINLNNDSDGNDVVFSGLDDYVDVSGMAGNDSLSAEGGAGTGAPLQRGLNLMGGAGADRMVGGTYHDYLWGDSDAPFGPPVAAGNDSLLGGDGGDRMYGQDGGDVVDGQGGGDSLYFDAGNDQLRGGDGSDYFDNPSFSTAADGADLLSGGRGTDSLDLGDRPHNLAISLNNFADDGQDTNVPPDGLGNELDNVMADMEYVYLGSGDDRFNANTTQANAADLRNYVEGRVGNDTIQGGEGDDNLYGGGGNDSVQGQAGNDSARGDADNDTVSGGEGDDYVYGGLGSDVMNGEAGNDYLWMEGSADGADYIAGGAGESDQADYSSRSTNTLIRQDNVVQPAPSKGNDGADGDQNGVAEEGDDVRADVEDVYTGSGNDLISANFAAANTVGANNLFDAGSNNDTIHGGVGEDQLEGGAGNDSLTGGIGEDKLYGEAGADRLFGLDTFYWDYLDGGSEVDTASAPNGSADAFDEKVNIP
jgi:Ca2+-binding RTX toxin-like protein